MVQSALDMRNKGANELLAAQKVKEEVSCWSQSLQLQFHELREKEQHLAAVSAPNVLHIIKQLSQ